MKKNLLVYSFSALIAFTPSATLAATSVGANVSGTVTLLTKTSTNFPPSLINIYQGEDESLTLGKKGKKIKVTGRYKAGAGEVRVTENTSVDDDTAKYSFDLPVPKRVSSFNGTFTSKHNAVILYYASENELVDNGLGGNNDDDNGGNNSLINLFKKKFIKSKKPKSPIKKFKKKIRKIALQNFLANAVTPSVTQIAGTLSVKKVVAIRKGKKGTLKGTFYRKDTPARGRFKLKMVFDE